MKRFAGRIAAWRRRWRRDTSGATAVEFALVILPFLWVVVGIMELALLMYFSNGIEHGVERAARLVRTGQAYKNTLSQEQFRDYVCRYALWTSKCNTGLKIEVKSFPDFASVSLDQPTYDQDGNLILPETYDIGGPRQVVVVRAFYKWSFMTILGGGLLGKTPDNSILIGAATTFRNEPF